MKKQNRTRVAVDENFHQRPKTANTTHEAKLTLPMRKNTTDAICKPTTLKNSAIPILLRPRLKGVTLKET